MSIKHLHGFERSELESLGGKHFKWYAIAIAPHILNNTLEELKILFFENHCNNSLK